MDCLWLACLRRQAKTDSDGRGLPRCGSQRRNGGERRRLREERARKREKVTQCHFAANLSWFVSGEKQISQLVDSPCIIIQISLTRS